LPTRMPFASTATFEIHFMSAPEGRSPFQGPRVAKRSRQETTTTTNVVAEAHDARERCSGFWHSWTLCRPAGLASQIWAMRPGARKEAG
jgi:hypothetical protein